MIDTMKFSNSRKVGVIELSREDLVVYDCIRIIAMVITATNNTHCDDSRSSDYGSTNFASIWISGARGDGFFIPTTDSEVRAETMWTGQAHLFDEIQTRLRVILSLCGSLTVL